MQMLLVVAAMAALAGPALAAEPYTSSGAFRSKTINMPVQTAIAFRGKSLLDKSDVIVVAVTNAKMHADVIARYYDRRRAVDRRINDNDTPVVYFEFKPDGGYRGYSFYFASGNGCGYCGGNMGIKSTIKLANGRLAGSLKGTDTDRDFDVTLDLPVRSDDFGTPLPPDGGAPGKAYLAYHDALVKRDAKALRPMLSDFRREYFAQATKHGETNGYMNLLAEGHPSKSVRITKGFSNGKVAVLLIDGESSTIRLTGEVMLVNEGGTWRVDDELTDVVMK
jgi:hypothetical protein